MKHAAFPRILFVTVLSVGPASLAETLVPMPNAGFELGATAWTIPAGSRFATLSTEQAASGRRSLKITDADRHDGSNVTGPPVAIPAPGFYELRGKVFPVSGSGLGIYLRFLGAKKEPLSGDRHLRGLGGSDNRWKPFSAEVMVPEEAAYVQLWIHSYSAAVVTAYLDDFELVQISAKTDRADLEPDMTTIKERLRREALGGGGAFSEVPGLLTRQRPDGSWDDLNYADQGRTRWEPSLHVSRAYRMARAYVHPKSPFHGDGHLKDAVLRAYDYWTRKRPRCPNWWYNVIGVPRTMYRLMLLIEPDLSPAQFAAGIEVLKEARLGMTGENLVWVAEVNIARGCLTKDPWLVQLAFSRLAKEIRITTEEGIQPDFSFYQHGAQLYSGGYGRGFAADCAHFARLARGTAFAFSSGKVDLLSHYLLDGEQWMVRGPTFDHSVCGREITRRGACRSSTLIGACKDMLQLLPPRAHEFTTFLARLENPSPTNDFTGNKHFWRADYMAHHRPAFMASVRMTSKRTLQTEVVNSENLLGAHLSDGLLYVYRRGDEYRDLFPVWDWNRLPGTTVELDGKPPVTRNGRRGERQFVGGVSDGTYGLAAMDFARGKLAARKAWYFSDGAILCLGAGITCSADHPVITTVNQCRLRGETFTARLDGAPRTVVGRQPVTGPAWVFHDGVGYLFPDRASLVVSIAEQRGSWWRINRMYPQKDIGEQVFSLWFEHGTHPTGAEYVYAVLPGTTVDELRTPGTSLPVDVVQNTPALQAVQDRDAHTVAAAFYEPGTVQTAAGLRLEVDQPCLVLLRKTKAKTILAVSNPVNEPLQVTVEINRKLTGTECTWKPARGVTRIRCALPRGLDAGQSLVLSLSP